MIGLTLDQKLIRFYIVSSFSWAHLVNLQINITAKSDGHLALKSYFQQFFEKKN
jgi:hypothetical protein